MQHGVIKPVTIVLLAVHLAGCSTTFGRHHDEEMVSFDANVPNVEVLCSGKRANTPGSIPLRQSKSHSCTAELEGYEKKVFRIRSGVSWSGFGHSTAVNTALLGWWSLGIGTGIGWLVDFASGAMRNLKEEDYYFEMKPIGTTGMAEKIFDKTASVGKALVNVPTDVVKETTSAVVGTTVEGGAEQLGFAQEPAEEKQESAKKGDVKRI